MQQVDPCLSLPCQEILLPMSLLYLALITVLLVINHSDGPGDFFFLTDIFSSF